MGKITFMGAGSTVFAKNVLGDCMLTPSLSGFKISLYDIDAERREAFAGFQERSDVIGHGGDKCFSHTWNLS